MNVNIVGAGAIGMMQALSLAQQGVEVTLLDKGLCGKEASWAGGGIVSPLYPWRYSDPVTALATWSQGYYPNLAETLEAESGVDPELSRHGLLMLAVDDEAEARAWAEKNQCWLEPVDKQEIYRLEPALREGFGDGLWMSQVASIRNPRLAQSLRICLERNPLVTIVETCAVQGFLRAGDKIQGVSTCSGEYFADQTVIASGAWSSDLLSPLGVQIDIEPVRGQMILFNAKPGLVRRIVMRDGRYVIPRRDGRLLAGSTLEYVGFDKQTTTDARDQLMDAAIDLFPELASCPVENHWAGLRPGSPDGVPYIGAIPGVEGLFVNAGHFRNGLVLAPASVALLTSLMLGEQPPVDPEPYAPVHRIV